MKKKSISLKHAYTALFIIAVLFALTACGEKKLPEVDREKIEKFKATIQTIKGKAVKKTILSKSKTPSDELIGIWEVLEARGQHAEANKEIVYEFLSDGRVLIHGFEISREGRNLKLSEDKTLSPKTIEWLWKRTGPKSLDLIHPNSPMSAKINIRHEEGFLILDWNSGSQIFKMKRIKELSSQ